MKLDWCIKGASSQQKKVMRSPAVRQRRTNAMAHAMNKTGRPMWLTFHCVWAGPKHEGSRARLHDSFAEWCAADGNSWRIGPDSHRR